MQTTLDVNAILDSYRDAATFEEMHRLKALPPIEYHGNFVDGEGVLNRNIFSDRALRTRLGLLPGIGGGARGYNTQGDVITQTTDGRDLRQIWDVFQQGVELRNRTRNALVDFLTSPVTQPIQDVPQFGAIDAFEVASEFGIPKSMRVSATTFAMGFPFEWYDARGAFTWKFLAEADEAQVNSVNNSILEADNVLVFTDVMRCLFNNANRTATINKNAYTVYALYNNDGTTPPPFENTTFLSTHTHYFATNHTPLVSTDVDQLQNALTEHGYDAAHGADLVLMVNSAQGDVIRNFRSVPNGGTAKYDFIPAQGTPRLLLPVNFVNDPSTTRPPATLRGMTVIGAYGEFTIVQQSYIPAGYLVAFATGGQDSLVNPVGIREHANPNLRGLQLVKGRSDDYPLQDAFYRRGFGCGIKQRGSAAVMQVVASTTYTPPAQYT